MELTYTKHGDYYLPDLDIPHQEKVSVNRYGQMHGNYLKKNNRTAYNELLFSGRLNRYLAELGEQAEKMLSLLTEQYAAAENVTEEMKAADQMGWIRAMNSIRNRAEEVVLQEVKQIAETGPVCSVPGVTFMSSLSDKDGNVLHVIPGQGYKYYEKPVYQVLTNFSPFKMDKEQHPWMGWDRYHIAKEMLENASDSFDVADCFEILKTVSQEVCPTVVSMVFDATEMKVYWCENRQWNQIKLKQLEVRHMKEFIAYCGLDCETCEARLATINNDDALREKVAKDWGKMNQMEFKKEWINCEGCRINGIKTMFCDSMCEIRKCALDKGFETCKDCTEMKECSKLKMITDHSEEAKANLE